MFNMIRADIYKMFKSQAIKILFVITTLTSITMTIMSYLIAQGKIDVSFTGIGFMFSDVNIISILGGVIAGIFICSDFDNKTIHEAITSGCSRGKVVISKAVAYFIGVAFVLLPYAIATGIALGAGANFSMGNVSLGFLHLLSEESGSTLGGGDILKLLAIMIAIIIVYASQLSICVLLALLLKRPVLVVGLFYGISMMSGQLLGLAESLKTFNKIYSLTPFGGTHCFMTLDTGAGDIVKSIIVSFVFAIIILGITYGFFRKAEIK